jgi:NADH-quinone oxidoreductase subunit D
MQRFFPPIEPLPAGIYHYQAPADAPYPYRLHLRAPCFHVVSALEQLIKGRLVADVIPTFGSMNMIGGELDR